MKAQKLYDFREKEDLCSGADLHEFFRQFTPDADPSPSGNVEIDSKAANEFVEGRLKHLQDQGVSASTVDKIRAKWMKERPLTQADINQYNRGILRPIGRIMAKLDKKLSV